MKKSLLLLAASGICLQCMAQEKIIVVNEGTWDSDNGRLTYIADGEVKSNQWFRDVNGRKLGDSPTGIVQINDDLIAIAVGTSNVIQLITPEGRAAGEVEGVPNPRQLATDNRYLYATSYAHEVTIDGSVKTFTKGYVAKIDPATLKTVAAVEVGYEPEGVAWYKGYLFVANSGGYAFQEDHDYESTVSVVDAATMKVVRTVDTRQANLYKKLAQAGRYLCINSPGDYYESEPATIILDCEAVIAGKPDADCFVKLDFASTANTADIAGNFLAVGSNYSYLTGGYEFNYATINPAEVMESAGAKGVSATLPGAVKADIEKMAMPNAIYVNPYSGYIYAADAGDYVSAGSVVQWTPSGNYSATFGAYISPAYFLALPPDGAHCLPAGVALVEAQAEGTHAIYNLQGIPVSHPRHGGIYIRDGKKIIL